MHVGLIGAGMMGHGMAANLLKHGHQLSVIAHRNRAPIEDLVAKGAREAKSLQDIAQAGAILLCVTTSKVVEDTIGQLRPHLRAGQIIMDAGTSAPAATRKLAHELQALGVAYADIPLTGGPEQAEQGTLGVLCGASPETFARISPLLGCFATTIRRFGPPGSGHTAKLMSNYLVTGMVALVAETFGAARAAAIDWKDLYEAMLNGSGNSGVLRKMVEPALKGDFDGYRFALANAAKDIGYYAELAGELGCGSKLTDCVAEIFARAVETGHGGRNVSQMLNPATDNVS
ncbi:NAD(P)-dependent oxidoreductase [Aestuariivirga sp.]|uniref:NAD(P)-dependent oxidoreductase n=1 Tax=Aestuariivirga sp. TaxID=2650926 RepID=UPI0025C094E4|nr:NAD(P)-dependent oxidoreductase [Aestuariivirga sp.]MCA3556249.1 NAD(P)-dependent oxidoreductase [Aestuariivirga sp.]